jgi:hypothetical protein
MMRRRKSRSTTASAPFSIGWRKTVTNKNEQQRKRFIETARALECDEDEAAFYEKLKRIAQAKPAKRAEKAKPSPTQK